MLTSPKLKIERAKTHIGNVNQMISAFLIQDPFRMEWQEDAIRCQKHLIVKATQKMPYEIPLIAADTIHNLRSALDHLACCLAVQNGAAKISDVYFPIGREGEEKFKVYAKDKIKRLSESARTFIYELKPYKGGNNMLYALHNLDVIDKHQTLPTAILGGAVSQLITSYDGPISVNASPWGNLEKGVHLLTTDLATQGECHSQLSSQIAFGDVEIVKDQPIISTLNQMLNLCESIIANFESKFFG
jgi:hypothetical protein